MLARTRSSSVLLSLVVMTVASLGVVSTTGCGGSAREAGAVEYSVSAVDNYERGMKRLEEEEWQEAAKYFAFVKARFPYSKYAVLADLRIADSAAGAEQFLDAVDSYRQFIRFHPTHELVESGYAAFKIGECYFHMLPDDWFLVPPGYEKDQTSALDAARELASFIRNYPKSAFVAKAKELYSQTAHLLAAHEWYVAKFYWGRNKPMGAVLRLRGLLKLYPDAGYDEEALWLLGQAYAAVGRNDDARKSWNTLVERFPSHARAHEAKDALGKLPATPPAPPPKPDDPAAKPGEGKSGGLTGHVPSGRRRLGGSSTSVVRHYRATRLRSGRESLRHRAGAARDPGRRAQHARRHPPRQRPRRGGCAILRARARHQPALHRGCAQPRRHAERSRQVPAGERSTSSRSAYDARRRRRAELAGIDPFVEGEAGQPPRRRGRRVHRGGPVRRRGPRVPPGARSVPDLHRSAHPSRRCPARHGRRRRRGPRARGGARAESRAYIPARLALGAVYCGLDRRVDASREWEAVLALDAENRAARAYLRMSSELERGKSG